MQHVLHVNNTGRDTTTYELIIIYIKPNCISSKFQISRANPKSQTYPPIYIMQRWKRERSRGYLHKDARDDFPHFSHPNPPIWGRDQGAGCGRRRRFGAARPRAWERREGGGGRKGAVRALLTQHCRARRGGAAVHVARQARAHVCLARCGWLVWHPYRAAACGAAKEACHATPPGAAKEVTRCK
jgi:hypothetical protein